MSLQNDQQIDRLLTRLDEVVRWRPGSKGKYYDAHSALPRIEGAANHLILGRRGSGKTRLLDELRKLSESKDYYVVSIGAEDFKELTYPDILIQILRAFLREFNARLTENPAPLSKKWWKKKAAVVIHPLRTARERNTRSSLLAEVRSLSENLALLLSESEELQVTYSVGSQRASKTSQSGSQQAGVSTVKLESGRNREDSSGETSERRAEQKEEKRIKVERLLGDFKHLLSGVSEYLDTRLMLAVDDFYFIRREDQPAVVDYMHRICKDTNAFLKIATIKHRSGLYAKTTIARGVVAGHEIQKIDLELPLGQFDSVERFLTTLWKEVCKEVDIEDPMSVFRGDGFSQAVLASGGVPRDFWSWP